MPNSFSEPNRATFEELRAYAESLTDEQLRQAIDEDWTVSATLAHVAFWDRRAALAVEGINRDPNSFPPRSDVDLINATAFPQWRRLEPQDAIADMIEAGEFLNRTVDALDEETAQRIQESGAVVIRRARHRLEHLEQLKQHLA
jgi:DinB superfamily